MMDTQFRVGDDIQVWLTILVLLVVVVGLSRLIVRRRGSKLYLLAGFLGYLVLGLSALRPMKVVRRGRSVGPNILVLADASRRLRLRADGVSRVKRAETAVANLANHFRTARLNFATFGDGEARVLKPSEHVGDVLNRSSSSNLVSALESLAAVMDERPSAIVVVSDGRLTRPESNEAITRGMLPESLAGVPIHAVYVGGDAPRDASIRRVDSLGQAVAHQPFTLKVEVACSGGLRCSKVPVFVRLLEKGRLPREIARLEANLQNRDEQTVNGDILLDRAGSQLIEVSIDAPEGDEVPENNTRLLPFNVTRDRIRMLHIAGSPSYDVRELRRWLKGNAAVDLVSFFILRTDEDDPNTEDNAGELSLIPFPVEELFTQHLPSFDAVVIQDIDAPRYHLDAHLERLARYVEDGGGLILVGGPAAFSGGGYVHSPLERVLPTSLVLSSTPYDAVEFVPRVTSAAARSPILEPLKRILGDRLPSFSGANTLGPAKPGASVLWEHPQRTFLPIKGATVAGPMPILAVADFVDGRVVELGLDATYRLAWGDVAAQTSGRAYGAFWEALIGWVMHDPQYSSLRGELESECIPGVPFTVRWTLPVDVHGLLTVKAEQLGRAAQSAIRQQIRLDGSRTAEVRFEGLQAGGYVITATLEGGTQARLDIACDRGDPALSDSRPDPDRLGRLSEFTGGSFVEVSETSKIPAPPSYFIDETRTALPIAPTWVWAAVAAGLLGLHWLAARSAGLR
jgi:uncharacterized membrane protein